MTSRLSPSEARKLGIATKRRPKYGNQKTVVGGRRYDSKRAAVAKSKGNLMGAEGTPLFGGGAA